MSGTASTARQSQTPNVAFAQGLSATFLHPKTKKSIERILACSTAYRSRAQQIPRWEDAVLATAMMKKY
jgi:hypothetical protein